MPHSKNHSVTPGTRIVLVDPDAELREVFAQRLRAQGFEVDEAADGVQGAEMALAAPPAAVISDLWMPGVSGVQLCRLLGAEAATADVPVVLRAEVDDARSRFWASHAGARRLVGKGRMGELVRTLEDVVAAAPAEDDAFFFRLAGNADVRDRIASHLDKALFESVVAAEVRSLAGATAFDRMFDSLSQLVVQLLDYRWVALITPSPAHFAIHAHRSCAVASELEARAVLMAPESAKLVRILDDDADPALASERTSVHDIMLGGQRVGQLAFGIPPGTSHVDTIAPLVARELGAVLRLVILIEESQRLATTDGLTGLFNRRAFIEQMNNECARAERTDGTASLLVLDLDHFKSINDTYGHSAGDAVLAGVAKALRTQLRAYDIVARWGGEEFVIALPSVAEASGAEVAERLRAAVSALRISNAAGEPMSLSVSIGCAELRRNESLDSLVDRADRAMYAAKVGGRNRVVCASADQVERGSDAAPRTMSVSAAAAASRRPGAKTETQTETAEQPDVVQN